MKLRIATRKSALALAQVRWVVAQLRNHVPDLEVDEVPVSTHGDRRRDVPLYKIGGKGLFVGEVEATLRDGRAELAVHSLKDVTAQVPEDMDLACIPEREDPRDVLMTPNGGELDDLFAGAKVGTSSLRRTCQLHRLRPDLDYGFLRGNVNTRLERMNEGKFQAVVLAYAGVKRLHLDARPHWPIPPDMLVPAVGQGALALEVRADDETTRELVRKIEDPVSRTMIEAERAMLKRLGGNCGVPLGGHARFVDEGHTLRLDGVVSSVNGDRFVRASKSCSIGGDAYAAARSLGEDVGEDLLAQGASELIRAALTFVAQHGDPRSRPS